MRNEWDLEGEEGETCSITHHQYPTTKAHRQIYAYEQFLNPVVILLNNLSI
jgi:hypothetical protein